MKNSWLVFSAIILLISVQAYSISKTKMSLTVESYIGKCEYRITGQKSWKTTHIDDVISDSSEVRIVRADDVLQVSIPSGKIITIQGPIQKKVQDILNADAALPSKGKVIAKGKMIEDNTAKEAANAAVRGAMAAVPVIKGPKATNIKGTCELTTSSGDKLMIGNGTVINDNSSLKLPAALDSIQLQYADGSSIAISGPSIVKTMGDINSSPSNALTAIYLKSGKLLVSISSNSTKSFVIQTESVKYSSQDGRFLVSYSAKVGTELSVLKGSVLVTDSLERFESKAIDAGKKLTIKSSTKKIVTNPISQADQSAIDKEFSPQK